MRRWNLLGVLLTILTIIWYMDARDQLSLGLATFIGIFTVLSLLRSFREKTNERHRD
ncbi:hypothetical protein ACV3PA_06330 [Exiguobacterium acetylicum]|uniref:hypothetical protein n=1 Tax=Exiguobacterium sp. BMC-KP TaxID=1684312 RepID=UPI000AC720F5|nr:hypothetical protein [Exiguobacterium sp. BMC-KP]